MGATFFWSIRTGVSAFGQTFHDGVEPEDWASMYNTLWEAARKVGTKKIGERTGLLWKLSKKPRAEEREDWWEVQCARLALALVRFGPFSRVFSTSKVVFPWESSNGEGRPKTVIIIFNFGPFLMKRVLRFKKCLKKQHVFTHCTSTRIIDS